MKYLITLLTVVLSFTVFGQKCDKHFKKQKSSSSAAFGNNDTVISKWKHFYNEGARDMYVRFTNMNGEKNIIIQQQTTQNLQFKQPIELGRLIRIAFIFDNNEIYILKFENSQEDLGVLLGKYKTSRNSTIIDSKLDELLKNNQIKKIEIQNAFSSSNINADKIINSEVKSKDAENIKLVYGCFLGKI